jgi:acyl carrier protein
VTALPGVLAACVELEGAGEAARLVAYFVGPEADERALRRQLALHLPAAMVPASFVRLVRLALTAHGKLDRGRMIAAAAPQPLPSQPEPTALEAEVIALWQAVLGVREIGVHDAFFSLGGHSLSATELVTRVREAFGVELPLRRIFEEPTVAGMAAAIVEARAREVEGDVLAGLLDEIERMGDDEIARLLQGAPR